jgi:hypothetical protein
MTFVSDQNQEGVREFDVRTRGAVDLVEQWKKNHDEVRLVWNLEELIAVYNECFNLADELLRHYQQNGKFPNEDVRFSYFADATNRFVTSAQYVESLAAAAESQKCQVAGADKFRSYIATFSAMLEEEGITLRAFSADMDARILI